MYLGPFYVFISMVLWFYGSMVLIALYPLIQSYTQKDSISHGLFHTRHQMVFFNKLMVKSRTNMENRKTNNHRPNNIGM